MTLCGILSYYHLNKLNNVIYVPKLGFFLSFGTISAVHFHHLSTHVTCVTWVHVISDFCHITFRFMAPDTQCLEKHANSDYLGIR